MLSHWNGRMFGGCLGSRAVGRWAMLCMLGCASSADDEGRAEVALTLDGGEPSDQDWQRSLGSSEQSVSSSGVTSDAAGNSLVTGYTVGQLEGNQHASSDPFVTKYSATGDLLWTRELGTADSDACAGVSTDASGNVFIAGDTFGALDGASRGFSDAFVAKYSPSGVFEWTRQLGTSQPDVALGVSAAASGDVFVAGHTRGSLEGTREGRDEDVWVAKYSTVGERIWTRQVGSSVGYDELAAGVSADADGNVFVAGHCFGGLEGDNRGSADAFVAKLSADGSLLWLRQLGGAGYDAAEAVSADGSGNVYISGQMRGIFVGGPGVVIPGNPYVAKYSPAGDLLWELEFEDAATGSASRVTTVRGGNAFIAGYTSGAWGSPNQGLYDSFVAELSEDGDVLWAQQLGFRELDRATGISADRTGHVIVSQDVWNLGAHGSDGAFLTRRAVGSSVESQARPAFLE